MTRRCGDDYVIPLRLWIADKKAVGGATVSGYVRRPDGVKTTVTLVDDGLSMDRRANDGMDMVEPTFDAMKLTKCRERLLTHSAAGEFFRAVVEQASKAHLMSSEDFTVDGALIEAWASLKSFRKAISGRALRPLRLAQNFAGYPASRGTRTPRSATGRKEIGNGAKLKACSRVQRWKCVCSGAEVAARKTAG